MGSGNKAKDQDIQLPRYLDLMKAKEFETVLIVYLTNNGIKTSSNNGYQNDDYKQIQDLFLNVPTFNNTENDLYTGWLDACINNNDIEENIKCIGIPLSSDISSFIACLLLGWFNSYAIARHRYKFFIS